MRRLPLLPLLALLPGCRACAVDVASRVEARVAAVAPVPAVAEIVPCAANVPLPDGPLDLPTLWQVALVYNPALREAAAEVEGASGRRLQAGLYPNPRLRYEQSIIGSRLAPQGNFLIQLDQELVTGGKRRLDRGVADREMDAAAITLLGRKFDILTRVRRAYYDYLGWLETVRANEEVVASLEQGLRTTRRLVEEVRTRPRADVLRSEALLEEARISLAASRANLEAAWRQLEAEVGVAELPRSAPARDPRDAIPQWDAGMVTGRVMSANTALREAAVEVERARLALVRAKAQAVPNVTLAGGYEADNVERTAGGVVGVETALPLWDRNQGNVHTAAAHLARAQAAVGTAMARLKRETAAAFATYEAARVRVERLASQVVPRLQQSLESVRQGFQAGSAEFTFADVLLAEQSLFTARLSLVEARRSLWLAVADLEGLMQLDLGEELIPCTAN
jgi:outer membrane protein, heavy metal efflux system